MFFWPKKIITLFFLPLHFAIFAGVAGLILLYLRRRERLARVLVTAAIAAVVLFSNKGVANLLISPLESRYHAIAEARDSSSPSALPTDIAACRYIVVLGGGHARSPGLSRINQLSGASLSRLTEAIRIFRHLPADTRLIVSGHDGEGNISHAQVLAEAALSLGIPSDRIIRFDKTRDTHDEALAVRALAGDAPVIVVTSAWHMPRAMKLCEGAGVHAIPCPADFMLKPGAESGADLLRFDLVALERSTKAIHEYLGLLWSALRGQT
ncbi:MAG: ElyC/SanA/YdcF family protein [Nibricoccus sp.]